MNRFLIHQIYYDEASRSRLDPGFIPLDNTANPRPDWYEFWPIRRFLHETPLDPEAWYGFLSPSFRGKTGLDSAQIHGFMAQCAAHVDVALFSVGWDQVAYFLNPFEQGEVCHPGLFDLSRRLFAAAGVEVDLHSLVTDASTTVYSNYIVAKPAFWQAWLRLADTLYAIAEDNGNPLSDPLNRLTAYHDQAKPTRMKVFVQERLASVVLASRPFRVASAEFSDKISLTPLLFVDDGRARRLLHTCDLLKQLYRATGDRDYLKTYFKLRALVTATPYLRQFRSPIAATD